jgi:enoyl-CoA hydratase/carnithine racemase
MDRLLFRQEGKIGYLTLNRADKYNAVEPDAGWMHRKR